MTEWPSHEDCKDECWFAPTLRALKAQVKDDKAEIARLTAERDQEREEHTDTLKLLDHALAQAAAAAMEMRDRAAQAAYHWWDDDDVRQHIRALPTDPDAQKALDEMLEKAREDAIREAADIVNKNRDISGWVSHDAILALINDGCRDE